MAELDMYKNKMSALLKLVQVLISVLILKRSVGAPRSAQDTEMYIVCFVNNYIYVHLEN